MTIGKTNRRCHREGCDNPKQYGRSYHYCSDECARIVALGVKRVKSSLWREANQTENRTYRLWTRFRLTPEKYEEIFESQGERCAICGKTEEGWNDYFSRQ